MVDANGFLIKSVLPNDASSVCVHDFCGYTNPEHFAISMWADYYPALGFTRFGGDWWNVPDMPSVDEPTEADVETWAFKHNGPYAHNAQINGGNYDANIHQQALGRQTRL